MPSFRFPLDRVLEWRQTRRAECEASGVKAELQVRAWTQVTGSDLEALGSFRLRVKEQEAELALKRAAQAKKVQAQQAAMLEARRRCRLLDRLKEQRAEEWRTEENRALEAAASETYLAQWRSH
jgi:hypothetical protein